VLLNERIAVDFRDVNPEEKRAKFYAGQAIENDIIFL
jgi:hypothetical protein